MATLMQKDVLIEVIAAAMADTFHYKNKHGESDDMLSDKVILREKRSWVYMTSHEDIDYPTELAAMQKIREKYKL